MSFGPNSRYRTPSGGGATAAGKGAYSDPFWDVAQSRMPRNGIKSLFDVCSTLMHTHSVIAPTAYKMAAYPITPITFSAWGDAPLDRDLEREWKNLLQDDLNIEIQQISFGLDYYGLGNCVLSLRLPFRKHLVCRGCKESFDIKGLIPKKDYTFAPWKFNLNCPKCKVTGTADQADHYIRSRKKIRINRWSIKDLDIEYYSQSGDCEYYYTFPKSMKDQLRRCDPKALAETPVEMFDALRAGKSFRLEPSNIFHFRPPALRVDDPMMGYGFPIILSVLKDNYVLQLLTKANEGLAQEHITPWRWISPAGTNTMDPFRNVNLSQWKKAVQSEVTAYKADPNRVTVFPIPVSFQQLGGQGKLMMPLAEMMEYRKTLVSGMGAPEELHSGGLRWCLGGKNLTPTSRGLLRMDEMVPSEEGTYASSDLLTTSHSGNSRAVDYVHCAGMKKQWMLRTRLGLEATPSGQHRWRVLLPDLTRAWKKTEDLVVGDRVQVRYGDNLWPEEPPLLLDAVRAGEAAYDDGRDMSNAYPVALPNQLTPELARLLGYLVAEGSTTGEKAVSVGMTDRDVIEDIVHCVDACFGYAPNIQEDNYPGRMGSLTRNVVNISRAKAVKYLQAILGKKYSADKVVPRCIRQAPANLVCEFLLGFFEGDGCVSGENKQFIAGVSTSEQLLREIQLLLLNKGIVSSLYTPTEEAECQLWQLQIRSRFVDEYAAKIGFSSARKSHVLSKLRTPTRETTAADRVPYVKEALDEFHQAHFAEYGGIWTRAASPDLPDQEVFSSRELAAMFGVDRTSVVYWVRKGYLKAERQVVNNNLIRFVFPRAAVQEFLDTRGLRERYVVPFRKVDGATTSTLLAADLTFVEDRDPDLAERVRSLADDNTLWDEVTEVFETDESVLMFDFTVRTDSSFSAGGIVSHNSSSSVALRMLENIFMTYRLQHHRMLNLWLIPMLSRVFQLPRVKAEMSAFRMGDDVQGKQLLLQLKQLGLISDRRLLSEFDMDPRKQQAEINRENRVKAVVTLNQKLEETHIMGEVEELKQQYQAKIMANQPGVPVEGQTTEGQPPGDGQEQAPQEQGGANGLEQGQTDMRPMPQQNPPRRGGGTAMA